MSRRSCDICNSLMYYSVLLDKFLCTECVYCVRITAQEKINIKSYLNDVMISKSKPLISL